MLRGLISGAIVTVEETRYRLRRLPIEPNTRQKTSFAAFDLTEEKWEP